MKVLLNGTQHICDVTEKCELNDVIFEIQKEFCIKSIVFKNKKKIASEISSETDCHIYVYLPDGKETVFSLFQTIGAQKRNSKIADAEYVRLQENIVAEKQAQLAKKKQVKNSEQYHEYDDPEYEQQCLELTENLGKSLEEGLRLAEKRISNMTPTELGRGKRKRTPNSNFSMYVKT